MKPKATLILGGGSALGLAHIGALEALERHFEISGIIGTSMGAIIGALFMRPFPTRYFDNCDTNQQCASFFPFEPGS
jgi:NTE family protein